MNTPLKTTLEIARLQHSERILSKTQQDAMLLAAPGWSECWQAHAKRQTVLIPAAGVLAAVADGVSLSPQAAFASRSFLQQLQGQFDGGNGSFASALPQLVRQTHRLWQSQCLRRDTRGASCTLAALLIRDQQVSVVNVGDSRVWRLRHVDGALQCQQLSHDHTLWQQMLDAGEVAHTGEQPASFYQDLTQCLTLGDAHDDVCADDAVDGSEDFPDSDSDSDNDNDTSVVPEEDWLHSWQGTALPGDIWLLATDGLHGCITGFELQNYWQPEKTITDNLNHLYAAWSASGGGDDISLMAMQWPR